MIARGIIHCHTTRSYDGEVGLAELCSTLKREGFHFVALTEHAQGISQEDYQRFLADCASQTRENFAVLPGLEICCRDGTEIAGIGLLQVISSGTPQEVIERIREAGAYALWAHPYRRGNWRGPLLDCDAVEVLNAKLEGSLAPNLALLREVRRRRRNGSRFHAIFGLDLHELETPRNVWLECQLPEVTPAAILEALRGGQFKSRTTRTTLSSDAAAGFGDQLRMSFWRAAWLIWAKALRAVPPTARSRLVRMSRPVVRRLKNGQPANQQ